MKRKTVFKSNDDKEKVLMQYKHSLSNFNENIQQNFVNTSFGKTHILSYGNDTHPKLVLLHGANSNATSWIKDFSLYGEKYKVYAVDIVGEPGKSDQNRLPYKSDNYSNWLNEVFQHLQIENANLIGLSQGGWLAVKFAVRFPEKVNTLILLSPAGIVNTEGGFIMKAVLYSLLGSFGKRKINQLIMGNQKIDQSVIDFMDLMEASVNSRMDKEYIFSDDELRKLTMPTFFIGGTNDVIRNSVKIKERLTRLLPDFTYYIDPEKGHILIGLTEKIKAFLSKNDQ